MTREMNPHPAGFRVTTHKRWKESGRKGRVIENRGDTLLVREENMRVPDTGGRDRMVPIAPDR